MRSTISPPKVLTVRSNSEMWRVMRAPSVPESRANFSASSPPWFFTNSSKALICKESESCAVSVWLTTLPTSEFTVTSSASLALSPEVRIWVARRLPASSILLTRSPERSSSSSNSESEEFFRESWTCSVRSEMPSTMVEERCSNSPVMRSIFSFSISWTRSARSTNSSCTWPVLKLRLVVSRSEASSTARVVSALASSRRSSRSPPRSPSARIMLSPALPSAAVMCDVLQQCPDPHLVVGIGALKRRHFVGDQGLQFARARDRALDAVAHRRDFAPDGLADGHHGIARRAFRLREPNGDLRHRLRDHPQFLAAPGEIGQEVEQQHRCEEQCHKTGQHQHAAALTDRGLQRSEETDGQKAAAEQPDHGKRGGDGVDAARRTALLDRLQKLPDGLAVV